MEVICIFDFHWDSVVNFSSRPHQNDFQLPIILPRIFSIEYLFIIFVLTSPGILYLHPLQGFLKIYKKETEGLLQNQVKFTSSKDIHWFSYSLYHVRCGIKMLLVHCHILHNHNNMLQEYFLINWNYYNCTDLGNRCGYYKIDILLTWLIWCQNW